MSSVALCISTWSTTALRMSTLGLLFIADIKFSASDLLIGVLRNIYGRDLVKGVRTLEKLHFKHKMVILYLNFLVSCRK